MSDCECLKGCPFFNGKMDDTKGIGAIYKKKYCLGENSECARFMVAKSLGKEKVPATMFPNMVDKAKEMLANA